MRFTLDFADSELRDLARAGDVVRLRLAAAFAIDVAGERGWLAGVTLEMSGGACLHGDVAHAFGRIAEVGLQHADRLLRRMDVPGSLAAAHEGEVVSLALRLSSGTQFVVSGRRLEALLADGARFTPDHSC